MLPLALFKLGGYKLFIIRCANHLGEFRLWELFEIMKSYILTKYLDYIINVLFKNKFFRNEGIIIILTFLYLYMWKSSFTFSIARPFLTFNKANLLRRFICINNLWVLFILGVSLLQKLMKLLRSSINIKKKTSQNTCIIFGMHAFLCEYATQKIHFEL